MRERPFRWQRKLMPGACEATCYARTARDRVPAPGQLPQHGQPRRGRAGEVGRAEIQPERIGANDYFNLVDLLVRVRRGSSAGADPERVEKMFEQRRACWAGR